MARNPKTLTAANNSRYLLALRFEEAKAVAPRSGSATFPEMIIISRSNEVGLRVAQGRQRHALISRGRDDARGDERIARRVSGRTGHVD